MDLLGHQRRATGNPRVGTFRRCSSSLLLSRSRRHPRRTSLSRASRLVLPELDKLVEQTLKKTGVPGMAIAVVCKDQVVYLKGFGVREAGKEERVDADTVFQLASVSKPMASTVLAALVGEGLIDWDDRVIDHDPGFRLSDPFVTREVTLRDLLCHRSGLPDHAGDLLEDLGYDRAEVLRRLRYLKPASSFRSQLRLHELRLHRGGGRRGAGGREDLGGPRRRQALPPPGHEVVEFSLRGLRGGREPRPPARPRRAASGSPGTPASPTPSPRPAAPARRPATWPGGCACNSPAARSTASRSSRPGPWPRRTGPRSSATRRRTRRPTGPASTGSAGT